MSRSPQEVVRLRTEAFNAKDVDAYLALSDPDVVYDQPRELPGAATYRGHEGIRDYFANLEHAWESATAEIEELIDAGEDVVISIGHTSYRGRASGVVLDNPFAIVWTIRDGRVVRGEFYFDRAEALAAAGL
jgi:ketosteroid isomerase-like protein